MNYLLIASSRIQHEGEEKEEKSGETAKQNVFSVEKVITTSRLSLEIRDRWCWQSPSNQTRLMDKLDSNGSDEKGNNSDQRLTQNMKEKILL